VPVLAFTGTATRDIRCQIISILGRSNPVVIRCNPNLENIFYASHSKLNTGEKKANKFINEILDPIVTELK